MRISVNVSRLGDLKKKGPGWEKGRGYHGLGCVWYVARMADVQPIHARLADDP